MSGIPQTNPHDPVFAEHGKWFFWDETWADRVGPFATEREARCTMLAYVAQHLDGETWSGPLAITRQLPRATESGLLTVVDDKGGRMVKTGPSSYSVHGTEQHMCGLSGYNPMLGDSCPACEQSRELRELMRAAEATNQR